MSKRIDLNVNVCLNFAGRTIAKLAIACQRQR